MVHLSRQRLLMKLLAVLVSFTFLIKAEPKFKL